MNEKFYKPQNAVFVMLALMIYVFAATFDLTMYGRLLLFQKVSDVLKLISILILCLNFVRTVKHLSKKQLLVFAVMGVVSVIEAYRCKSMATVLLFAFWINMDSVQHEDIFNIYFLVLSAVSLIAIVTCVTGIIPNYLHSTGGYAIGFVHPNHTGMAQLAILMSYIALRKDRMQWFELLVCAIVVVIMYLISNSAGTLVASILIILFAIAVKCGLPEKIPCWITAAVTLAYPVISAFWIFVSIKADLTIPFWKKINKMLTGRLELNKSGIINYGMPLLGQYIDGDVPIVDKLSGEIRSYNFIDSSLIRIPVIYGIVFAIIIAALYSITAYKVCKKKQWYLAMVMLTYVIHGMVDGSMLIIAFNPVLIYLGSTFFDRASDKKPTVDLQKLYRCLLKSKSVLIITSIVSAFVMCIADVVIFRHGDMVSVNEVNKPYFCSIIGYIITGALIGLLLAVSALSIIYTERLKNEAIS